MKRKIYLLAANTAFVWITSSFVLHTLLQDETSNNEVVIASTPNNASSDVAALQDEIFEERFSGIYAKIPLTYNQYVKRYIDEYLNHKDETAKAVGLSEVYFPIFDQILPKYNVPRELNALAIVESNLNNHAISPVGAAGMWQLMKGTSLELGLQINNVIDERKDTYAASHAAAMYLSQLYDKYGDWLLAVAAYNCGPGNVNKAIRRAGGKTDFWKIRKYLPSQTRNYVPKLMAAIYILNYYNNHKIYAEWPGYYVDNTHDIMLKNNESLQALATEFNVKPAKLKALNPGIKNWNFSNLETPIAIHLPNNVGQKVEQKAPWQLPNEVIEPINAITDVMVVSQ